MLESLLEVLTEAEAVDPHPSRVRDQLAVAPKVIGDVTLAAQESVAIHHPRAVAQDQLRPCDGNRHPIRRVGVVGTGAAFGRLIAPALFQLGFRDRMVVCGLAPPTGDSPGPFLPVLDRSRLPLPVLARRGFLGPGTLWLVATSPEWHVPYALQLAETGARVAIVKPVTLEFQAVRPLLEHANRELYALDHKVFNEEVLRLLERFRTNPEQRAAVRHVEGRFLEPDGFPTGRGLLDTLLDVTLHLVQILQASLGVPGAAPPRLEADYVAGARHRPDPDHRFAPAPASTATWLIGRAIRDQRDPVSFRFLQAKAAGCSEKWIRCFDADGRVLAQTHLEDPSAAAYARMVERLCRREPAFPYTLADAVGVAEFLAAAGGRATRAADYPVGSPPEFEGGGGPLDRADAPVLLSRRLHPDTLRSRRNGAARAAAGHAATVPAR